MSVSAQLGPVLSGLDRALGVPIGALDWIRTRWLKLLGPLGRLLVRDRELRVGLAGAAALIVALLLTLTYPLVLLAVSPLVLGVPHVGSDLRYLLFRPGLHRRWSFLVPLALCLGLHAFTFDPRLGFLPLVLVGLTARHAGLGRRLVPLLGGLLLVGIGTLAPRALGLVFAHAHNFVAIAIFLWWRPRARRWHWLPVVCFALGCAVIVSGVGEPLLAQTGGWAVSADGTDLAWQLAVYAPDMGLVWGGRLVLLFAFAQAMHYGVWLRLVPEEDRPRETPRTFAASFAALRQDWGRAGTWTVGLVTLALAIWAVIDLYEARMGYLRLVLFHGYFELAAAALLWTERRPVRSVGAAG